MTKNTGTPGAPKPGLLNMSRDLVGPLDGLARARRKQSQRRFKETIRAPVRERAWLSGGAGFKIRGSARRGKAARSEGIQPPIGGEELESMMATSTRGMRWGWGSEAKQAEKETGVQYIPGASRSLSAPLELKFQGECNARSERREFQAEVGEAS